LASFRITTFGCKVNQCDSQIIRETLTLWGLTEAAPSATRPARTEHGEETGGETGPGGPDLVVINTCTVTGTADAKFRKALRRIKRENPRALTAVTGCFASRVDLSPKESPGANLVFRMREFSALADFLYQNGIMASGAAEAAGGQSYFAEHTRAFLKIQDGCDCFCTYCIVPAVRPRLWSEEPDRIVEAINTLSSKGYSEVVLAGIHLGFFGRDTGRNALAQLLRRIEAECEIGRVRLSSIEINEVSEEMLELIAGSKKFCRHLHMPLQSGDGEILQRMGRRYSAASFLSRVGEIRRRIPDIGLTTDLMTGFPGETDEQFERTLQAVEHMGFAKIHVFRFSPRPGTKAAEMGARLPAATISSRARRLISLGEKVARKFKERFIGQTLCVLAEKRDSNRSSCIGYSSNYINVKVLGASADRVNRILPVRLTGIDAKTGIAEGRLVENTN